MILTSQMVLCHLLILAVWQDESTATEIHSDLWIYTLRFIFFNTALMPEGFPVFSDGRPVCILLCYKVLLWSRSDSTLSGWPTLPSFHTHSYTHTALPHAAPQRLLTICVCFPSVIVHWLLPCKDHRAGSEAARWDDSSTHFLVTLAI